EAEALRDPALDLPFDRTRVDRLADLLRRTDPHHPRQSELDVDFGDDLHRADAEGDVSALTRHLPGVGIERARRRVPIDTLDVDLSTAACVALGKRGAAGVSHGAAHYHRLARGGGRARRIVRRRREPREPDDGTT